MTGSLLLLGLGRSPRSDRRRWSGPARPSDAAGRPGAAQPARPAAADRWTGAPLQVVAADLRRLRRQLALVPAGAPMARRRALQAPTTTC